MRLAPTPFNNLSRRKIKFRPPRNCWAASVPYPLFVSGCLGGIHWGLAIAGFGPDQVDNATFRRLAWSVVPSLIGWCALLLLPREGLPVLAAAFILLFLFDLYASRQGEAPAWYPSLRWPLTMVVVASLLVGALA
jgi:hypothetical protein